MDATSWGLLLSAIIAIVTIANAILDIVSNKEKMIATQRIFRVFSMIIVLSLSFVGIVLSVLNAESLGLLYPLFVSFFVCMMVFKVFYFVFLRYIKEHQKQHDKIYTAVKAIADRLP